MYDWANWGLIASLVVGVVSTFFVVRMGNVKEAYLKANLSDTSERAAKADARAAEANERAAINEREAQGLRARADEAELELARLAGPPYLVPVIHGVAKPDLSKGNKQVVRLTGDTRIVLPELPKGKSLAWTVRYWLNLAVHYSDSLRRIRPPARERTPTAICIRSFRSHPSEPSSEPYTGD
jgi:hypothetical protein